MAKSKNIRLKKSHTLIEYTPEQMAEVAKCMDDPIHFMKNYVIIKEPMKGQIPFALFPYQEEMVRNFVNHRFSINLLPRQVGKCLTNQSLISISYNQHEYFDTTIGDLYNLNNPTLTEINDSNNKLKFIGKAETENVYVKTPSGLSRIKQVLKTVSYEVYHLQLKSGKELKCADDHIVLTNNGEKYIKDLNSELDHVHTIDGYESILSIKNLHTEESMYDLELEDDNHLYYTNGITSHNTEVISAYLLWFALFHDTKTIIVTSNVLKSAKEVITKIADAYELVPDWLKPGISEDDFNKESLSFDNKSRIIAQSTSKDSCRGYAVSILYCDEFAIVPEHIQKDFYGSVFPVLSTGGQMIISSTAGTDTDLFSEIWRAAELGANTFHPFTVPWDARPGRDEVFKQDVISNFGIQRWLREYENIFSSSDTTLIDTKIVSQIEAQIQGFQPAFTIGTESQPFFKKIDQDATYLVGVDPATGSGNDYTVIEVVEFPSMQHVMEYRTNSVKHSEIYSYLKKILTFLEHFAKEVYFSVESNGVGQGILALYDADEKPPQKANLISDDDKDKIGMFTTDKNKIPSCLLLKTLFEAGGIAFYSPILLKELKSYKRSKGSYEAKKGATDDCISAILIILRILQEISAYDTRAYHKLYSIDLGNTSDAWVKEVYREEGDNYNRNNTEEDDVPMPIVLG